MTNRKALDFPLSTRHHAILTECLPMIKQCASRYLRRLGNREAHFDDLVQEGFLGAVYALRRFDEGRHLPFIAWAEIWTKAFQQRYCKKVYTRERPLVDVSEAEDISYTSDFDKASNERALETVLARLKTKLSDVELASLPHYIKYHSGLCIVQDAADIMHTTREGMSRRFQRIDNKLAPLVAKYENI